MMQNHLKGSKTSCKLWTIEIFESEELNLHVVAWLRTKTSMFFLTRVGKVSFGCKDIAKNKERKASLTFKRLYRRTEMV